MGMEPLIWVAMIILWAATGIATTMCLIESAEKAGSERRKLNLGPDYLVLYAYILMIGFSWFIFAVICGVFGSFLKEIFIL